MEKKKNLSDALRSIPNKFAIRRISIIGLAVILSLGIIACGSPGNPSGPPKILVELSGAIAINPESDVTIGMELTANYAGTEKVTYQWKNDGKNVGANTNKFTPSAAGSHTVTVSAAGFRNKTSAAVTVTIKPTPGLAFTENDDGTYSVSKGTIIDAMVIIPPTHNGKPVTGIADDGFANYSAMTFIGIPDSVTSIGDGAFSGCTGFKDITIPNSVTSIGFSAFSDCSSLTSVTIPFTGQSGTANTHFGYIFGAASAVGQGSAIPASLKTVIITGGTSIADNSFSGCASLTNITIPNVTSIGNEAFSDCSSLTSLTDLDGVKSIGSSAFSGCTGLTSVTIPANITSIGKGAFSGCTGLESITIPFVGQNGTANPWFGYIFGVAAAAGQGSSIPAALKTVTITGGTSIANNAFSGCTGLTSVIIPASVTSIGSGAFSGCTGLANITIPFVGATVDGSKDTHFGYIFGAPAAGGQSDFIPSSVKTVTITGGTSIASDAFSGCKDLTSVIIPSSVKTIGNGAFKYCYGLTSIKIPFVGQNGITNTWFGYIFGAATAAGQSSSIPASLKTVIITGGTSIASNAFLGCAGLTSVIIPDSVKSIDEGAFSGCKGLVSITIPRSVTKIVRYTFRYCEALNTVYYGSNTSDWGKMDRTDNTSGTDGGFTTAAVYYYSETRPGTGNYWHFVDGVPVIW